MQRRRAGDDHEQPDDAGQCRARSDVDPLVVEVFHAQLLVGRVRLDEREAPRREGGADGPGDQDEGRPAEREMRHDQASPGGTPVRVREDRGADVGHEDGREQQQDVLDPVKAASQDKCAHHERRDRHRDRTADSREVEAGRDAGEFRSCGAEVRNDQRRGHDDRRPLPVAGANERDEAGSGDDSEASAELVEDHECCDRDQQHPQQLVAVTGPRDRVRRDPGGVVVGEAGEEARA